MYTYGLCQTAVIIDYKVIPVLADVLVVILDLSAENFGLWIPTYQNLRD